MNGKRKWYNANILKLYYHRALVNLMIVDEVNALEFGICKEFLHLVHATVIFKKDNEKNL